MSGDLVTFLRARLDEDEAAATAAEREMGTWGGQRPSYAKLGFDVGDLAQTFNPARVLREVAAKRAIVRSECSPYPEGHASLSVTLRQLAAVYRDHPDYRPEWAPLTTASLPNRQTED